MASICFQALHDTLFFKRGIFKHLLNTDLDTGAHEHVGRLMGFTEACPTVTGRTLTIARPSWLVAQRTSVTATSQTHFGYVINGQIYFMESLDSQPVWFTFIDDVERLWNDLYRILSGHAGIPVPPEISSETCQIGGLHPWHKYRNTNN